MTKPLKKAGKMTKKPTKKLHVKPTKKELEENIEKSVEEIEALKNKPISTPEPVEEPEPSKEIYKDVLKREKEKRIASSQEAQILHAKNKKINEALEKAQQVTEPTEEEMVVEYPDWEMMSDFEKKMAKDGLISKKRFAALDEVTKDFRDSDKWQGKVEGFISDPQSLTDNPDLEGREDEFKLFATKPTRRGVDFSDLVSAFLYEADKDKPKMRKGSMFETGTGGPAEKAKPKSGKITIEEAKVLRENDYKKYIEYLKAGKIATTDI